MNSLAFGSLSFLSRKRTKRGGSNITRFSSSGPHRSSETTRDKRLQIQTALPFKIPYAKICEILNVTEVPAQSKENIHTEPVATL
jgi:hypothetical protein